MGVKEVRGRRPRTLWIYRFVAGVNAAKAATTAFAGYDVYRDYLNTPVLLTLLPDVAGLRGLDVSPTFLRYAREEERREALGIVPRGAFRTSITHPFLDTPYRGDLRGPDGGTTAYEVGGYFEELRRRFP